MSSKLLRSVAPLPRAPCPAVPVSPIGATPLRCSVAACPALRWIRVVALLRAPLLRAVLRCSVQGRRRRNGADPLRFSVALVPRSVAPVQRSVLRCSVLSEPAARSCFVLHCFATVAKVVIVSITDIRQQNFRPQSHSRQSKTLRRGCREHTDVFRGVGRGPRTWKCHCRPNEVSRRSLEGTLGDPQATPKHSNVPEFTVRVPRLCGKAAG